MLYFNKTICIFSFARNWSIGINRCLRSYFQTQFSNFQNSEEATTASKNMLSKKYSEPFHGQENYKQNNGNIWSWHACINWSSCVAFTLIHAAATLEYLGSPGKSYWWAYYSATGNNWMGGGGGTPDICRCRSYREKRRVPNIVFSPVLG